MEYVDQLLKKYAHEFCSGRLGMLHHDDDACTARCGGIFLPDMLCAEDMMVSFAWPSIVLQALQLCLAGRVLQEKSCSSRVSRHGPIHPRQAQVECKASVWPDH